MMGHNVYWTKDVAENLGIVTSTLRKWCLLMEKANYTFDRNEKGQRVFYDKDMIVLRKIKQLTQRKGMTLESAIYQVVESSLSAETNNVPDPLNELNTNESKDEKIEELEEKLSVTVRYMEEQKLFNKELLDRLNKQQDFFREALQQQSNSSNLFLQEAVKKEQEKEQREKQLEMLQQQYNEEIQNLNDQFKQLHAAMQHKSEDNDQSEENQVLLREIKEAKEMIAAGKEKEKRGFWGKIFKKSN